MNTSSCFISLFFVSEASFVGQTKGHNQGQGHLFWSAFFKINSYVDDL